MQPIVLTSRLQSKRPRTHYTYIQTILHYPDGGGAYTVAKDNLGRFPSLIAGGALLTDYILTVSVSSAAGVRAVTSAFPEVWPYRIWLALFAIAFITWMNLRGVRESGTLFAFPTYAFVGGVWVVLGIGMVRYFGLFGVTPLEPLDVAVLAEESLVGFAFIWLILRAFAGGTTALTGIEAISNGVQAFKPPESQNAAKTMVAMGFMAMSLFVGIGFLATNMHLIPMEEGESILSQMTRRITGGGFLYFWVQAFTALILFLAANTGYQDFPRLSSFLARDDFLPRWMRNRGDRLVFSSGIVVLAITSSIIVILFQANEIAMLPLYALGVMFSFTLCQSGMFVLMGKIGQLEPGETAHTGITEIHHEKRWRWKRALNGVGAVVTGVVFFILLATKFADGAWIVALLIPLLVAMFYAIHRHYVDVAASLSTRGLSDKDLVPVADVAIVPIADVHRGSIRALVYARRIASDVRAVSIATVPEMHERNEEFPGQLVTVVVPEFIAETTAGRFLHNQTANFLRRRLRHQEDLIIIDVPYPVEVHKGEEEEEAERGTWWSLR